MTGKAKITHETACGNVVQRFNISSIQNSTHFVVWDTLEGKRYWIETDDFETANYMITRFADSDWKAWFKAQGRNM